MKSQIAVAAILEKYGWRQIDPGYFEPGRHAKPAALPVLARHLGGEIRAPRLWMVKGRGFDLTLSPVCAVLSPVRDASRGISRAMNTQHEEE